MAMSAMDPNIMSGGSAAFMSGSSSSTYAGVRYKKSEGSLILSAVGLEYRGNSGNNHDPNNGGANKCYVEWKNVVKHQVSPVTYPKALLKLIVVSSETLGQQHRSNLTFQFTSRSELDRIRKEITVRLQTFRGGGKSNNNNGMNGGMNRKRPLSEVTEVAAAAAAVIDDGNNNAGGNTCFGQMDPVATAVARSALLAAHPALRQQHQLLVQETQTVSEEDFWHTHHHLLQEEYARIAGMSKAGTSSLLQSHLPTAGRVSLGVEEMRQIFILYPAVHKAYEEKVPLELSDEQFWRKYLESEYFHRDRGRMGTAAKNHAPPSSANGGKDDKNEKTKNSVDRAKEAKDAAKGPTLEQQDARAAAVGTDDLFSRYDQKLQEAAAAAAGAAGGSGTGNAGTSAATTVAGGTDATGTIGTGGGGGAAAGGAAAGKKWGRRLAVGQFDLASTLETERGAKLLSGPVDNHPPNPVDDGEKGARVIQKYNRHWAMVLHAEKAVAGSNLMRVAASSVADAVAGDDDAKAAGGNDGDFRRLVRFASAAEEDANHALGVGLEKPDDDEGVGGVGCAYEELTLQNVEAYSGGGVGRASQHQQQQQQQHDSSPAQVKKHHDFAMAMAAKTQAIAKRVATEKSSGTGAAMVLSKGCFPAPALGRELLSALTKKMAADSKTQAASLEMVHKLPAEFRDSLQSYFRRSSELLRHFYGLRKLEQQQQQQQQQQQGGIGSNNANQQLAQKLARIVRGMETFYREMEQMRKSLPQTETGQMMSKMCMPIMDQLDWAFKLHREGATGGRGGGGFVDVEEL